MVTAHGHYAAWASWLDAFAKGTDLPSQHLAPVDDDLGPHMQERLLLRLKTAFETRAQRWGETLRRHLAVGTVRQAAELGAVLAAARGRLQPLRALAADVRLPEQARTAMVDALREMVHSAQDSLENSVRRQPQDAERLLAVVRENSLLAALAPSTLPATPQPHQPLPPVGRRVIL